MNILSIQSQVVYGHVGNSAALFILQRLGHDTWSIPTTLFSNHLARPSWTGRVLHKDDIAALIDGLEKLGVLDRLDAVVTGYLGDPGNVPVVAQLIDTLRHRRADFIYACDPVMGDDGELYVKPALAEAIAAELVGRADILTPNRFELQRLSGQPIGDQAATIAAAQALRSRHGIRHVIATGVTDPAVPQEIAAIAATPEGLWHASGPRIEVPASGAGDSFAALLVGHYLRDRDLPRALAAAVAGTSAIFAATAAAKRDELAIIGSQETWANLPASRASKLD
ncbi:MAG TPA: pyridoxal kinase [Dongiaceae bacterium]|nr:pyridoxal kinase [Dongiaceae bacterium]